VAPNGDLYVTDGYGNARVHCFSPEGKLKFSWGEPGREPGHFNLPHGLAIGPDETLYVCDRQNNRIQLFTLDGKFIDEWTDFERPADCFIQNGVMYVAECKRSSAFDGSPSRVTILDLAGNILARLGGYQPYDPEIGHHTAHGICVDSEGSIYVSEVGKKSPEGYIGIKKYRR
jgi:sugar lactone lactonase YvrE